MSDSLIERFRETFENPKIHSFEPAKAPFQILTKKVQGLRDVHIANSAMGASQETKTFFENEFSDMSSFLETDENAWGSIAQHTAIQLDTVDDYCNRAGVEHINILKSDTQGYDLEVLRGARRMLENEKVDLIYLELIFSKKMYERIAEVRSGLRLSC